MNLIIEKKPLVSVLLPINRDDGYFELAVRSILEQSFKDYELLLIANNCSDELWQSIKSLSLLDKRIKPFRLMLGGITFALNYGLNIAQGEFIARMDADDISYKSRLETQVAFLDRNSTHVLVGTKIRLIDEFSNPIENQPKPKPTTHDEIVEKLYWTCPIAHPSVMYRRKEILKIGGYKYGFYGEDYDLWLRLIDAGYRLENIDSILLDYRIHGNQLSISGYDEKISTAIKTITIFHYLMTKKSGFIKGIFYNTKLASTMLNIYRKLKRS